MNIEQVIFEASKINKLIMELRMLQLENNHLKLALKAIKNAESKKQAKEIAVQALET